MHELLEYFINHYYPRQEIAYRLPMSIPISDFWPEELRFRLSQSVTFPLRTVNNESYWYVPTSNLLQSGDLLSQAARDENTNNMP